MDESAIKGLKLLELNDNGADSQTPCVAFMRIEGEDVEEKALQLSGTDVGGWTAIVKPAPLQKVFIDDPWCPAAPAANETHTIRVTGYDTSLPEIDLQMALCKHFSSCGEVWRVMVLRSGAAYLYVNG